MVHEDVEMASPAAEKAVLLELNPAEPDRPVIKIDGAVFHMKIPDDFVYAEFTELLRAGHSIDKYFAGKVNEKDAAKAEERMDALARKVLHDVPPEVFDKLSAMMKLKLISLFSRAVEQVAETLRPEKEDEEEEIDSPS